MKILSSIGLHRGSFLLSPDSARIFPLSVGEDAPSVIGTPFYCFNDPDDLGKKIADRLTKVYRDSVDD